DKMVAQEFLKFVGELKITEYMGVEDFADKLSFQYSVLVMMLCTTIVSVKQYLSNSIACYIPTGPSGTDFDKYIENYCWVHGTIPILSNEDVPQKETEWDLVDKDKRI
ncbi:Innexin inx2, partial [Cichlidogyrus casuarinus]